MKSKKQNTGYANKRKGHLADDNDCRNCLYYKGKIRGCSLTACSCEDINLDVAADERKRRG